jgi:hypothetical protein
VFIQEKSPKKIIKYDAWKEDVIFIGFPSNKNYTQSSYLPSSISTEMGDHAQCGVFQWCCLRCKMCGFDAGQLCNSVRSEAQKN